MLLNYIYYRDGKIHYNTLASFYKNNKWLFTDVLKDVYELEDENCAQFVYDDYEGYYGIVVKATDTNIEVLKTLLFQHIQNHIQELMDFVTECQLVQNQLEGEGF